MRGTAAVAPHAAPCPSHPQEKSVLAIGRKSRLALWLLVVFVELSSVTVLVLWAVIYFAHDTHRSLLWVIKTFVLFSDAYNFLDRFAVYIASGYTLLSLIFLFRVARLLFVSIRNRELRFGLSTSRLKIDDPRTASSPHKPSRWVVRRFHRLQFLLGIHGPYFEYRLLFDEVTELVFQTIAAHTASRSISNIALNQTYGVVILINSLSTTVFQHIFRSSKDLVKQRVARLLADLVLDFVWGTVLPAWMYQPIIKTYYEQRDHGDSIDFTENSAREVERVFVLSWWSFVLSVVPFCNSLLNLAEVRSLLQEQIREHVNRKVHNGRVLSKSATVVSFEAHAPFNGQRSVGHTIVRGLHVLVACTGVAIFITSLVASNMFGLHHRNTSYGCVHHIYPWFAKNEACVGRTIDCGLLGIAGTAGEVEAALQTFDASTLADLFFIDCGSLNISTPSLHSFSHLQTLVITNSTIVAWDRDVAALSDQAMPDLRTVKLMEVVFNASVDTVALFTVPLSRSAEWVYIIDTNMSEALFRADVVGDNWKHLVFFDCVSCSLTEFPLGVVSFMSQLTMLSLMENDIRVFPEEWPPAEVAMLMVWLDGNPGLTELPDGLWRQALGSLESVFVQDTSITVVPTWLDQEMPLKTDFKVYAFGSPLCNNTNASTGSSSIVTCEYQIL